MTSASLTIDLDALAANWRALDGLSAGSVETAACVKADAYGLGCEPAVRALWAAGCKTFFVAVAEEGVAVRRAAPEARVCVFSGHMAGDTNVLAAHDLIPMLNSAEQADRHLAALPGHPFGVQLDSGMNRLGMEPAEWAAQRDLLLPLNPVVVMSHLACADEPSHVMNGQQNTAFREMVTGVDCPVSLAATGGTLLGAEYHFDMTRPGIGLYGGLPFADAAPVVRVSLPVIQTRVVKKGETVGYGNIWTASRDSVVATVSGGYADGLIRAIGRGIKLYHNGQAVPLIGRVSMDLITVDITKLPEVPETLDIMCPEQGIEALASAAGTIGYEILTSLGARYTRSYHGGGSAKS
ncbi:MAG: alanine racemase [Pseudomonadota bacterium]